jgi:peptidoglycan/xylan/chitin deacetylase (PgdA/CDA1 family)
MDRNKHRRTSALRRVGAVVAFAACSAALTGLAIVVAPARQGVRVSAAGELTASDISSTTTMPSTTTTPITTTTTTTTTLPARGAAPVTIDMSTAGAPVFSRIPTTDPVVFLTIDDGIVQDPAVIGYIRDQRIPVTLFPVPAYVEQNESYFQAIHALGASVQDHTVHHLDLTKLSVGDQRAEICGPLNEYQAKFGARPWIFRPPYGSMNASVQTIARSCGIRAIVLWRASTNDGRIDTQGGPLQPGDIVLMHFRTDLRRNLEVALNAIKAAGLHPANLADYLTPG